MTKDDYIAMFDSPHDAQVFEQIVMSACSDNLKGEPVPPCVLRVLDDEEPDEEYWQYLAKLFRQASAQ